MKGTLNNMVTASFNYINQSIHHFTQSYLHEAHYSFHCSSFLSNVLKPILTHINYSNPHEATIFNFFLLNIDTTVYNLAYLHCSSFFTNQILSTFYSFFLPFLRTIICSVYLLLSSIILSNFYLTHRI